MNSLNKSFIFLLVSDLSCSVSQVTGITPTVGISPYTLGTQMSGYPVHATSPGSWVQQTPYVMQPHITPVSVSSFQNDVRLNDDIYRDIVDGSNMCHMMLEH